MYCVQRFWAINIDLCTEIFSFHFSQGICLFLSLKPYMHGIEFIALEISNVWCNVFVASWITMSYIYLTFLSHVFCLVCRNFSPGDLSFIPPHIISQLDKSLFGIEPDDLKACPPLRHLSKYSQDDLHILLHILWSLESLQPPPLLSV